MILVLVEWQFGEGVVVVCGGEDFLVCVVVFVIFLAAGLVGTGALVIVAVVGFRGVDVLLSRVGVVNLDFCMAIFAIVLVVAVVVVSLYCLVSALVSTGLLVVFCRLSLLSASASLSSI